MTMLINYNGKLLEEKTPVVSAGSRGLRYGDGLFEMLKMLEGEIKLFDFHMDRLFAGLLLLHFEIPVHFTKDILKEEVLKLCRRNKVEKAARIRLNIFRSEGGLFDPGNLKPNFLIEAMPLPDNYRRLNENGLMVDVYPDILKSCDMLSNYKTNNYLPYVMAAFYAKHNRLNDCLVLNQHNRICDSTMANIFWVRGDVIFTTPLSEGCVAGVMRRFLLEKLPKEGYLLKEEILSGDNLENAGEVFLTNAAYGVRWVKQFKHIHYSNLLTKKIYEEFL